MDDIEVGDQVIITVGKKQLHKLKIPKELRGIQYVDAVDEDNVYFIRPGQPNQELLVQVSKSIVKTMPHTPTQAAAIAAMDKLDQAVRLFEEEVRSCYSKKDWAEADDLIGQAHGKIARIIYSTDWRERMAIRDAQAGWKP